MKINPRQKYYKEAELDFRQKVSDWLDLYSDLHYSEIITIMNEDAVRLSREEMREDWKEYDTELPKRELTADGMTRDEAKRCFLKGKLQTTTRNGWVLSTKFGEFSPLKEYRKSPEGAIKG